MEFISRRVLSRVGDGARADGGVYLSLGGLHQPVIDMLPDH